jgi:hypothetical protein
MAQVVPDVRVIDGQPVEDVGLEVICIGMTAEDLATDGTVFDAGLYVTEENFDINCLIRVWNGGTDLVSLRTRAVELFEIVKEQVRGNPTLKGAVTRARVASISYSPLRLPEGSVVNMAFRVRCRTLTS